MLRVVTAFTAGHSLTLIAAALGWVSVPGAPVEVLIAASVGVAAVHAIRPLAARGEVLVALGFGLVHGPAFAGILADLGIDGSASVLSRLAFNVGIELANLTCVAAVFPSLYLLSRTRFYPAVRLAGATFGAIEEAAVSQLVEHRSAARGSGDPRLVAGRHAHSGSSEEALERGSTRGASSRPGAENPTHLRVRQNHAPAARRPRGSPESQSHVTAVGDGARARASKGTAICAPGVP